MTTHGTRDTLLRLLYELRPEAEGRPLPGDAELREELDLDSMDVLNLVVAIADETGVEIPEEDYARVSTLDDCVRYIDEARRTGSPGA